MTVSSATRKMKGTVLTIACVLFLQQNTLLHAAPPIEPCPHDSIPAEDTCKCNYELCSKPPCLYELTLSVNETDTPGSCCAIYTCEGCSNDTLIEDKCPCAAGAVLNSKGQCKCVDPHKSLVKDECVCDPNLCELPQICGPNYVSVSDHDECCSKTKCIKCPTDSFSTNNNDEAVEDKCVCYPCTEKECGTNEKVVIMQQGNGFPGSCCDMYRCEKESPEKMCDVGGVVYGDGDVWENPDSQMCKCQGGISFCSKQSEEESFRSCHKEGSVYKHNESWMLDSCTNCTCLNGEAKCIAHFCEVSEGHLKKPECQPLNCSKACPDGYRLNKRGCKTCKCNYPYKYDDILHKYNITKNKLKDILDEYFAKSEVISTTAAALTTVAAVTNISDEYHQFTTPTTELDGCSRWKVWMWLFIAGSIIAALTIAICGISWLNRRKKGSYDTNPARSANYKKMKLTKNAIYNNNNCIGNDNKDKKSIKGGV